MLRGSDGVAVLSSARCEEVGEMVEGGDAVSTGKEEVVEAEERGGLAGELWMCPRERTGLVLRRTIF